MNLRSEEAPELVVTLTEVWRQVLGNPELDETLIFLRTTGRRFTSSKSPTKYIKFSVST